MLNCFFSPVFACSSLWGSLSDLGVCLFCSSASQSPEDPPCWVVTLFISNSPDSTQTCWATHYSLAYSDLIKCVVSSNNFTLDNAFPWVLTNTSARYEVDQMNSLLDMWRANIHTHRRRFQTWKEPGLVSNLAAISVWNYTVCSLCVCVGFLQASLTSSITLRHSSWINWSPTFFVYMITFCSWFVNICSISYSLPNNGLFQAGISCNSVTCGSDFIFL